MNKTWDELTPKQREEYANKDWVGRDSRIVYVDNNYLDSMNGTTDLSLGDIILNSEDLAFIDKAGLTQRQRDCLFFNAWEGWTQQKIGKYLNIPQQTVSFHIIQAKKKILKFIKSGEK